MKIDYVSQVPYNKRYKDGRLPVSERQGELPGHKAMRHSTMIDVTPRHIVEQNNRARQKRIEDMFSTMKAVESVPVATRGRGGVDLTATEDYKALAGMEVTDKDSPQGWFAIDCGSPDKAKKTQANVNRYARAGAGTFRTRLLKNTNVLYVKRIAEEYVPQRGAGSED